jgi:REP element-mobilizing transposase RayT
LSSEVSKLAPVKLNAVRRAAVEQAVKETCEVRKWSLIALNVRTNHVHIVVAIGEADPGRALNALKANATRTMREKKCWMENHSP